MRTPAAIVGSILEQLRHQWRDRGTGLPELVEIRKLPSVQHGGRHLRPLHFHRFRRKRGLVQPDTIGCLTIQDGDSIDNDYRPLVPVTAEAFSDKAQRERWIEEKGMQVLNFFSDRHKVTSVDVFVTEPFDFDTEYDNPPKGDLAPGLPVHFVSIPTLIRMKEAAGRPRDLDDIQHLRWILNEKKEDESDR